MKIEVLISSMYEDCLNLCEKMNLKTNAVIINQCDEYKQSEYNFLGNIIKFYSFNERGVGRSRNNAILLSSADVCVFADSDMAFEDDYEEIVAKAFDEYSDADAILFQVDVYNSERPVFKITRNNKMNKKTAMKYGIIGFAIKRDVLLKKNVFFSLLFGGGAKYGSGEDTIFFLELLRKNIKIYTYNEKIGNTDATHSSWFKGFNEKYFFDKGALYAAMWGRLAYLLCIIPCFRWYKKLNRSHSIPFMLSAMKKGIDSFL